MVPPEDESSPVVLHLKGKFFIISSKVSSKCKFFMVDFVNTISKETCFLYNG